MGARRALLDHGRQRTGIVKSKGYKAPQEHPERARACLTRPELQPKANPRIGGTATDCAMGCDAGDLPLVDVEVGHDGFGGEEGSAAAGALAELLKTAFGRAAYAN